MSLEVLLTADAHRDLADIYTYIAEHDTHGSAERVLERISAAIESVSDSPQRGSCPKELAALGIREYRQVFFKPYRVVYRVIGQRVYIYMVADGRRDMQTLLARRLLGT